MGCLVQFSNRKLLAHHLRYNSGWVCLLSSVTWMSPLCDEEARRLRTNERVLEHNREINGLSRYLAERPAIRHYGPLRPFYDLQGNRISVFSNLHPFGPNKPKYRRAEFDGDDDDDEDPDEEHAQ